MAKVDYAASAAQIVELVGGKDNISKVTHCITRVRFMLKDQGIASANSEAISAVPGVIQVVEAGGQYQVVIGTAVEKMYDEVVALTGKAGGEVDADEAQPLAETANRQFADDGLIWSPETPQAWTLQAANDEGRARIAAWAQLHCRSARMVAGRRIDAWQPEGEAARSWRALVNELQMLWHEHPVNEARSQAGRPALNSVWLEGSCSRAGRRGFDAVITSDDALAGLALSAGSEVSAVPAEATPDDFIRFAAIQEDAETLLLDPGWWRIAVADGDTEAWQQAWDKLDTLIERLTSAGDPPETLVLGGERDLLEFRRRPSDLWALWRKRRLAELLAAHR